MNSPTLPITIAATLRRGVVIPAMPLALDAHRRLDERRQRALCRYYAAAGGGGLAVGVHTTQFAIRDPAAGLFEPLLVLIREEMDRADAAGNEPLLRIGGICGDTRQAATEASLLRELGYHAGLLSLAALPDASDDQLLAHCQAIGEILPLFGFYLQPAAGGRPLSYRFWRQFAEVKSVVAIKIAPFDRYRTLEVVRAVAESGRNDIALYTGNDDNIVPDLLTPYRFNIGGKCVERRIVGGLLGQWSVWTSRAVEMLHECHAAAERDEVPAELLRLGAELTGCNQAIFDAPNRFAGCIPGIHEVLRRQGLLANTLCLNPAERLSPGQSEELDRIHTAYPHLNDDQFVAKHLDDWLR